MRVSIKISKRELENTILKEEIMKIYNESKNRSVAPKIHQILCENGFEVSIKRVQRKMKKLE